MDWDTSCKDWERRLIAGESIVPCGPLFPERAAEALRIFRSLKIVDVSGNPTLGEIARPWVIDYVSAIFGAYDEDAGRQLIRYSLLLVAKKNSKALALDTEVATPTGFCTIGDLSIGDYIIGNDGKPTKVIDKSPIYIQNQCYNVTFSTGESVVCDAHHLWLTEANRDRYKPRVKTTEDIASCVKVPSGKYTINNHRMRLPAALDLPEIKLPIPPYVLGYWLGNGNSDSAAVTAGINDAEFVYKNIANSGHSARIIDRPSDKNRGASVISIAEGGIPWNVEIPYRFIYAARELGIVNNKHIPQIYLRGSFQQRLDLLHGLMDSDGTISKAGQASYSTITPRLRDGVIELINSMGLKASYSESTAMLDGKDCGLYWSVQFWPFDKFPVFTIPRKLAGQKASYARNAPRSATRQIVSVEKVNSVPVQCISVDNESKQFLITRSLIPTHNSSLAAAIMITALMLNWRNSAEYIILAPTVEVANNSFGPAKDMVRVDDGLSTLLHVQPHFRMITHRRTGATLKVIAAENETVSGKKASGVFVDELWLFGKRANADSMLREATGGLASRPEGFVIYASTHSDQPSAGVFADTLREFRGIRDGKIVDKRSMPVLYEYPERMLKDGSYKDRDNWYITNPNLGASVDEEFISEQFAKAERAGESSFRIFAAKHLNVEIGIALRSDGWAGATYWDRGIDPSITFDSILERCDAVAVGIDGGGLEDLLGVAIIGREKVTKRWLVWTHAFVSPEGMDRRKINTTLYEGFIQDNDLTLVEQLPDDLAGVSEIVERVKNSGLLSCVGVDAIGIGGIVDAMDAIDVTEESGLLRSVRQGISLMGAIKTVERKLADKTFLHSGSRMMAWCVGNAQVVYTPTAMRLAREQSGAGKIDPLAAVFDAAELMMANPTVKSKEMQLLFFGTNKRQKDNSLPIA